MTEIEVTVQTDNYNVLKMWGGVHYDQGVVGAGER